MKKILALILVSAMSIGLLVGCGEKESVSKVGSLASTNVSEDELNELISKKAAENNGKAAPFKMVVYDNLPSMIMALQNGEIDKFRISDVVAQYIVFKNDNLERIDTDTSKNSINGYAFLFTEDNADLRERFNDAIEILKNNGKLIELLMTYLVDSSYESLSNAITMPVFDGKETITVAITGDMPPMDYIDEGGNPAGFNTALLAEIANILEINIKFISIDSASRAIALTTGKADVSFWACATPESAVIDRHASNGYNEGLSSLHSENDIPQGTIISIPYYTDQRVSVQRKSN